MKQNNSANLSKESSQYIPQWLSIVRHHPLFFYFLLTIVWSWSWECISLAAFSPEIARMEVIPASFGPIISALLLTTLTEGKAGIMRLLRRFLLWRVSFQWYLLVLIGVPLLILLSSFAVPGAMASFQAPDPAFALRYLSGYIVILLVGGPLGEEPGWRGFALPHLQQRCGPLVGSLVLGLLWGLWHLPLFFIPGYNGAGSTIVGAISAFIPFVISTVAMAIIFTWVSNNARSSLLLVILLHASIDTAGSMFTLFFPSSISASLLAGMIEESLFVIAALLIIVATRGHLSYERYLREAKAFALKPMGAGEKLKPTQQVEKKDTL